MNKAVFIDKDGTLIRDVPYNVNPDLIELSEHAGAAMARLKAEGFMIIVISNQSGVAHGYFEQCDLQEVKTRIIRELQACNVAPDGFYFCPHHPKGKVEAFATDCECRKPKPGLILKAAHDLCVDVTRSWMIGDILHDVEAGNRAGCKTILINNGNETVWDMGIHRQPFATADNLMEAADIILSFEPNVNTNYDVQQHRQQFLKHQGTNNW